MRRGKLERGKEENSRQEKRPKAGLIRGIEI
jgi:hypothetical protein